jgi:hypothetical protein
VSFARLLVAWALSMAIFAAIIQAWHAAEGQGTSGFASGMLETFIGIGILLAIPTFIFALVVGWPTVSWLAHIRQAWLVPLLAAAVLALAMWVLAKIMLPGGWLGVEQTLVGYAAVLGFVWGCLNLAAAPAE